ncbi:PQQ-dependent sugar dehydrogenase [Gayadomonas joobiniege]|uniref:PQQ-dependent sugar dehydrogenase n=1 Tax=Gayadomonas joobiniege TaxID=1234606 RepID=UPI0003671BD5|nr:PQQ-dependent sugar dehydrogenase [Gayadomonas joobiniege]
MLKPIATSLLIALPLFSLANDDLKLSDPIKKSITSSEIKLDMKAIASGLTSPVTGTYAPGLDNFVFVLDQIGKVYSLNLSSEKLTLVADLSDLLVSMRSGFDERGLLGLAFHPDFSSNGLMYTYSSQPTKGQADFELKDGAKANHHGVVQEWQTRPDKTTGIKIKTEAPREILRVAQPQFNHNGGTLIFDDQKMLLLSLGDGGRADDQGPGHVEGGNGQDPSHPLGSILRIDPLAKDGRNQNYGIPKDNPFINKKGFIPEIFVYGVRNPYRISHHSGTYYVADVGQNSVEELTLVKGGENLGWPLKEGSFAFDMNGTGGGFVFPADKADLPAGLTDPNVEYDRGEGISIIAGHVYQGPINALKDKFIFAEWMSHKLARGRLFVLTGENDFAELQVPSLKDKILGFAQTASGDVLVLTSENVGPDGDTGKIFKLIKN